MTKETKNTDDLINSLCDGLEPKKACCPYSRILLWAVFSVGYLLITFWYFGLRGDLAERLSDGNFIFEMALASMLLLSSAMVSSWLSFPDCHQKNSFKAVPVTLFATFIIWIVSHMFTSGMGVLSMMKLGHCATDGLYIEIIPFIAIVFLTIKGRTTAPYWSIFMNVLAVAAMGWISLRLTCSMDNMGHSFLNHLLPFSIIGAATAVFARKIFKW